MRSRFFRLSLLTVMFSVSALAHDEHCHRSTPEGALVDEPSFNTSKQCKQKGGFWMTHGTAGCHRNGTPFQADSEQQCVKAGGRWNAQGHDRPPDDHLRDR